MSDVCRAIELNQDDGLASNERGHAGHACKDYAKAIADSTQAIR